MRARALFGITVLGLGATAALTGCSGAAGAAEADVITFATMPVSDDPSAVNPVVELAALLEAETGATVEVVDVPDYLAVVEAVRKGHADLGLMSGFPSALAVNTGEVQSLMAWPGDGNPVSTCIVLDDSPLQTLTDIRKDTVVAFADPASSSGYVMPVHMLDAAGLTKDEDFTPMFSGSHEMSFLALEQGEIDVACTSTMLTQMYDSDYFPFSEGETRSLGESDTMPVSLSVLAPASMDADRRTMLLEALPEVFSEKNKDALGVYAEATGGVEPILEPPADLFAPFVKIAEIAGVELKDLG